MGKRATTTVQSLQKATAREEKQLERRKVKLIRMQLDAVLDARPDLHQSILDFAERLSKKNPKGASLDDDDDDDDDKEAGSKVAEKEKSTKRAPDRAEHKSKKLEEWQRNLSRLSADDLSLILYEVNPQLFTSYNLASLRTSKKQRVIPKLPLLQLVEMLTNFSPEEPLVPPFINTIGDVATMVTQRAGELGNRDAFLGWPLNWDSHGLYVLEPFSQGVIKITQRFTKGTALLENGRESSWPEGASLQVVNNYSYSHAAVVTGDKQFVLSLRALFTVEGEAKELEVQAASRMTMSPGRGSGLKRRMGLSPKMLSPLAKKVMRRPPAGMATSVQKHDDIANSVDVTSALAPEAAKTEEEQEEDEQQKHIPEDQEVKQQIEPKEGNFQP